MLGESRCVRLRLLRGGFGFIQAVQLQVRGDEIRVGKAASRIQFQSLLVRCQLLVILAQVLRR